MDRLLSFTQEPAFKVVLVILLLVGGAMFLGGLIKGGLGLNTVYSPLRGSRFLRLFARSAINIMTVLAIFVFSIIANAQGETDLSSQFMSSLGGEFLGPLLDSVDFRNNVNSGPLLLFYYMFLTFVLNLIVGIIKGILDLFKNYHILFWWFTESVTIVFGTFLFILAKNSFERSHPIDQLNDITFIIIILIIAVISVVILLIDFPGVLGDLLFTIPMALAASFITMGIALLFVLAGGLSWMEKLEFLFTGPNSIPYLTAYIVLILIFFFLWYFVWLVLHAV